MLWDIFCKLIDNYGDIGVCWRLATDLAARGDQVRLWADDPSPLAWMAPQGCPGVQVLKWNAEETARAEPGAVVIEAFGCELDAGFVAAMARQAQRTGPALWINLEYLSAEAFAERTHGLPSPVLAGPGAGLTKFFFYPGFTARTGGLLREGDLAERQAAFGPAQQAAWLAGLGIAPQGERLVSLFCYEPPALGDLLGQLNDTSALVPTRLLVTAGRAQAAVRAHLASQNSPQRPPDGRGTLSISYLPHLTQRDYDHLLWSCDLNFLRGEDSLVRALWAGRPFVWQIYPQHDGAHQAKLQAFMDAMDAPASLRGFSAVWNGVRQGPLPAPDLEGWRPWAAQARGRLWAQTDLATRLLAWQRQGGPKG